MVQTRIPRYRQVPCEKGGRDSAGHSPNKNHLDPTGCVRFSSPCFRGPCVSPLGRVGFSLSLSLSLYLLILSCLILSSLIYLSICLSLLFFSLYSLSLCSLPEWAARKNVGTVYLPLNHLPEKYRVRELRECSNLWNRLTTQTAVDGCEIRFAPPNKPWNLDSPVNTNHQWFEAVRKDVVHPQ